MRIFSSVEAFFFGIAVAIANKNLETIHFSKTPPLAAKTWGLG